MTDLITRFTKRLQQDIASADDSRDRFIERLMGDASYALSWSRDEFKTQAKGSVAREILNRLLKDNRPLEAIYKYSVDQALRVAKFPPQSTSPTSNLMEQNMGAAWADIAEWLGDRI